MTAALSWTLRQWLESPSLPPAQRVVRLALRPFGAAYGALMRARRAAYRNGWIHSAPPAIPCISVGNLTVGGTGKTPFVIRLAQILREAELQPAVVSRGYGATDAQCSDEEAEIRNALPEMPMIADPDRARGIRRAHERGANIVVLDDAFQHMRIRRNLNIVLFDAVRPFGGGACLPAGLLREPPGALADAEVVVLTRADQSDADRLEVIEEEIRRYAPAACPVLHAEHTPQGLRPLTPSGPDELEALRERNCVLVASIARPDAFRKTLESLGARIVAEEIFPDHHAYRPGEVAAFLVRAKQSGGDWVVTTGKDAVKLAPLLEQRPAPLPVASLEIAMRITRNESLLHAALDPVIAEARNE